MQAHTKLADYRQRESLVLRIDGEISLGDTVTAASTTSACIPVCPCSAGQMGCLLARCLFLFSSLPVSTWLSGHLCVVLSCSLTEAVQQCMLCLVAGKEKAASFSQNPMTLEMDEKSQAKQS